MNESGAEIRCFVRGYPSSDAPSGRWLSGDPVTDAADSTQDVPDLVPARMLNEFTYCPRLAWLEWVQGDFVDSADTVEGRRHHRRVDRPVGSLPTPEELTEIEEQLHARSVHLSSPAAGLVARIDLVEANGKVVTPIDYKRGEAPDVPEGAWEPERVQLCAQGLSWRTTATSAARECSTSRLPDGG